MARVNTSMDILYNPKWNQAESAKFDHIEPYPNYNIPTDISLCSAQSKYDPSWLADFINIDSRDREEELELLEDLKALEKIRKRPLKFRKFEEFMKEYESSV